MTWKSTSSNGQEYLIVSRRLGFESYVCQLYDYFDCITFMVCL